MSWCCAVSSGTRQPWRDCLSRYDAHINMWYLLKQVRVSQEVAQYYSMIDQDSTLRLHTGRIHPDCMLALRQPQQFTNSVYVCCAQCPLLCCHDMRVPTLVALFTFLHSCSSSFEQNVTNGCIDCLYGFCSCRIPVLCWLQLQQGRAVP